jgi:diadenosine tetraphosphate (Ap4A) HIT family hydrolase
MELVDEVKRQLDDELRPDGYNVGSTPARPPHRGSRTSMFM